MNVVFPWGRECTDTLIAPPVKQLHCELRSLRTENQYTGGIRKEASAFQRWQYQFSWDDLNKTEGRLLDLMLNQLKGEDGVAEIPVWTAYLQPNIQFLISGNPGAQQCTLASHTGLQPGMYFRAGDSLHQITAINGDTATVKPLLRTTHNMTTASTYRPKGRFQLTDDNAAVRWSGARASADLSFMEFF